MKRMTAVLLAFCLVFSGGALAASPAVPSLSAGNTHALYVDEGHRLWGWGDWYESYPIPLMEDVAQGYAGFYPMALKTDGTLWVPGEGGWVQLMEDVAYGAQDKWMSGYAAVKTDGSLWAWGDNTMGQLAPGGVTAEESGIPVKVMEHVADVALGYGRTMALKTDGTLWAWGHDSFGKLGAGEVGDVPNGGFPYLTTPVQVLEDVAEMAAGANFSMAVKTDGTLWVWGLSDDGFLPQARCDKTDEYGQAYRAVPVQVMEGVAHVASGHGTSYVLKTDGTLWAAGSSSFGALGSGVWDQGYWAPVQIMRDVAQVSAGECFGLAQKTDGSVWGWGSNYLGVIGNGGSGDSASILGPQQATPIRLSFLPDGPVRTEGSFPVYPGRERVRVDEDYVILPFCACYNEKNDATNYARLRDVAAALNGTAAQFSVDYDAEAGEIVLTTGGACPGDRMGLVSYFTGEQYAQTSASTVRLDGVVTELAGIVLTDGSGGGYTYFKLRDLGKALGFNVTWRDEQVIVETDKPYTGD